MHRDLDDLARDLRDNAHHEGAHAGVARVGRQAVSYHRPAKKHDADDENDQCPAPQRIGAPWRRRRRRDLLMLSNLHFVYTEPLGDSRASVGGDPIDIRRLPAGFEARITSLTDSDNGKSRVARKMAIEEGRSQ